ncbi:MAG: DUF3710 domain-containing protein [Propionibacteriaceae bacterium]|nr:DUF3710 domain-containing protein [Propionibacteriaceae bacterium]
MFGRKKQAAPVEDDLDEDSVDEDLTEDDDEDDDLDEEEADETEDGSIEDEEPKDEWEILDASRDWREDGPFDITEVDLDADDVQRLDFGSLIVTPFDGMKMQMQVNEATEQVQALLVVAEQSAIEVALFAAPLRSSMLPEVRDEMRDATHAAGGTMTLVEGPLGTEVRRKLPAPESEGRKGFQPSRTWLVQGPRWLLRGVLMGQSALTDSVTKGEAQLLFEFFCNLVVRRGDTPRVPGELIGLDIPAAVLANVVEQDR